mgnify:CR=1 FL=1
MKPLQRLELLKDLVQEAVDRGATSVEQIHQSIADLPFEALERMGLLDADGREISELRETKTRTIGFVYDAIRRMSVKLGADVVRTVHGVGYAATDASHQTVGSVA